MFRLAKGRTWTGDHRNQLTSKGLEKRTVVLNNSEYNYSMPGYAARKPCIRPQHKKEIWREASMVLDAGPAPCLNWCGVFMGWKGGRVIGHEYATPNITCAKVTKKSPD